MATLATILYFALLYSVNSTFYLLRETTDFCFMIHNLVIKYTLVRVSKFKCSRSKVNVTLLHNTFRQVFALLSVFIFLFIAAIQVALIDRLTWNFNITCLIFVPGNLLIFVKIRFKMADLAAILFPKKYSKIHRRYIFSDTCLKYAYYVRPCVFYICAKFRYVSFQNGGSSGHFVF